MTWDELVTNENVVTRPTVLGDSRNVGRISSVSASVNAQAQLSRKLEAAVIII
jgi:hypothetical protein